MISAINGYICTSSCEIAEAKHGKDPQAPAGLPAGAAGQDEKTSAFSERPAGHLKNLRASMTSLQALTNTSQASIGLPRSVAPSCGAC